MPVSFRHFLIALSLLLVGSTSWADPPGRKEWHHLPPEARDHLRQQMMEEWRRLTPEEREARKQAHREKWQKLSPEEREAFRERHHQERQHHLQHLSSEEREALRETMRRQHRKPTPAPESGDAPWK